MIRVGQIHAPFGSPDWIKQVEDWLRTEFSHRNEHVVRIDVRRNHTLRILWRVTTTDTSYWMKAVAGSHLREFAICQLLAARHSVFPRVLASNTGLHSFVLEHVEGVELNDCPDLAAWQSTTALLAELQMFWLGHTDVLLAAGAADLRLPRLVTTLKPFIDGMEELFSRQPAANTAMAAAPALTRADLATLTDRLEEACMAGDRLSFAATLANADFSPHNVLISAHRPTFLDWAEAAVAFPLITGEYLWNRMVHENPDRKPWTHSLRATYRRIWLGGFPEADVDCGLSLSPLLALYSLAVFIWQTDLEQPGIDRYLRSLVRRMHKTDAPAHTIIAGSRPDNGPRLQSQRRLLTTRSGK